MKKIILIPLVLFSCLAFSQTLEPRRVNVNLSSGNDYQIHALVEYPISEVFSLGAYYGYFKISEVDQSTKIKNKLSMMGYGLRVNYYMVNTDPWSVYTGLDFGLNQLDLDINQEPIDFGLDANNYSSEVHLGSRYAFTNNIGLIGEIGWLDIGESSYWVFKIGLGVKL
ncbi:MAG: outer membrane beta-barrel protein [Bacteroidetes bacterium]|nr:outer membrane beta-barrel protein [Bacteroidota bacterium]